MFIIAQQTVQLAVLMPFKRKKKVFRNSATGCVMKTITMLLQF